MKMNDELLWIYVSLILSSKPAATAAEEAMKRLRFASLSSRFLLPLQLSLL